MADFCMQCTNGVLGMEGEENDLSGITTEADWNRGLASVVICEGCGPIQVDPQGRCVSIGCMENHNTDEKHIPWHGE